VVVLCGAGLRNGTQSSIYVAALRFGSYAVWAPFELRHGVCAWVVKSARGTLRL
jgi:hypothetical protein